MQRVIQVNLQDMIRFSRLMLQFQDIIRAVDLPRGTHRENDVEHSYQLAMMAWYLNSTYQLGYDTDRIIRYALVHDLAEAYAGDVHAFDLAARQGKAEREARALEQMAADVPGLEPFIDTIQDYDDKQDEEAKFIYALDKLMPMLVIYLEGGSTWRQEHLDLTVLHDNKAEKVALSEPVNELYLQLKAILDTRPEMFEY